MVKVNPVSSFERLVVLEYVMLYTKFQSHQSFGSKEEILEGFYHIWDWKPSWSCDLEHLNNFSSQNHMETPYEIWLQKA